MQKNRIVVMALAVLCVSALALAQAPTHNWTAPPYWSPPAGEQVHQTLGAVSAENVPVRPEVAVTPPSYPFTARAPCRLVDTRHGPLDIPLARGLGIFGVGESRNYDLTLSSACPGLPAGVAAWSLEFQYTTMNVPGGGSPSYLTAWAGPSGSTMPSSESTILGYPDRWIANSAIIEAGSDGTINVYCQNGGDVIIEVNGYYAPHFEYGYIYNVGAQSVAIEAAVTFDTNGSLVGITHTTTTSGITVVYTGAYEITFSVSGVEPNQFALFVNGSAAASSIYGSGAGTQQNNGQVILNLFAGDVLTIVNHSSAAAVTLQTLAGGTQTNVNASVLIRKLN
jgi:hypothetical protein